MIRPRHCLVFLILVCFVGVDVGAVAADELNVADIADPPNDAPKDVRDERPRPVDEPARRTYLGRIVAQPMSHRGTSWLVRDSREAEERVSQAYQQLGIESAMTVVDMGCGNGFWTLPIARDVGPDGRVLAVDIQPEMLQLLMQRADRQTLANVVPTLGLVDDPKLPAGEVDLVLMVDVYHEFSHPESMLWSIRRSLSPTGVVALLEYRGEDPEVPIKPLHKMTKRQILKEYTVNGFKLVREHNALPWQHLMFFARDDSPLAEINPAPIP